MSWRRSDVPRQGAQLRSWKLRPNGRDDPARLSGSSNSGKRHARSPARRPSLQESETLLRPHQVMQHVPVTSLICSCAQGTKEANRCMPYVLDKVLTTWLDVRPAERP